MSDLDFHLKVGDKVQHTNDDSFIGIITQVEINTQKQEGFIVSSVNCVIVSIPKKNLPTSL